MTPLVSPRKPMRLLISNEDLKRRILNSPDDSEVGAGAPVNTPEDAANLVRLMKTIIAAQDAAPSKS